MTAPLPGRVAVAVETPRHTSVSGLLDYASEQPLAPGTLVRVPLGKRDVPGLVWERSAETEAPPEVMRPVTVALTALPPPTTNAAWASWRWRCCRPSCASWTTPNSPAA